MPERRAPGRKPPKAPPRSPRRSAAAPALRIHPIAQLFRLTREEQRLIELLMECEEPLTFGQARRRLELGEADLIEAVLPEGMLRAHALVETEDEAALSCLRPSDRVHAGRGLSLAWSLSPTDRTSLLGHHPGVMCMKAPDPDTAWASDLVDERPSAPVADLVRDHLVATEPRLLLLSGAEWTALLQLARALRTRLGRPVALLDCQALAGLPPPRLFASLRRLRRDADLCGAVLIASEVQHLGGSFRGLCAPRPPGQTAPIILSGSVALPAVATLPPPRRAETALPVRAVELRTEAPAASAPAPEGEVLSATREEARRRAAMDAARAMGKPLPPEFAASAPRPAPAAAAPAPSGAAPAPSGAPAPRPAPAAAAPAPPSPPSPPAPARTEAPAAGAVPPAAPVQEGAAQHGDDAPPIPLAPDAPLSEIVQAARTTPNAQQRIDLLRSLAGHKNSLVIAAFRQNLASPHEGVRQAAEEGMTSLFGPGWERSFRAVAPPVQPPRSDDGGRGPGGAF